MSAPFVGKRVEVIGTSREELNGQLGIARDFDCDKARYTVLLDNGQAIALKPSNLQESDKPAPASAGSWQRAGTASSSSSSSFSSSSSSSSSLFTADGVAGLSWPTIGLFVMGAAWLFQFLQGGGSVFGGNSSLFDADDDDDASNFGSEDRDESYLKGAVREVVTLDQFKSVLAYHSDNTGLPVVVDFFSHSCGPCRMIAPTFTRAAKQFKGQAVFLKVDVNRNYEAASACNIRGMPTFQFFLNKKKIHEFSGADSGGIYTHTGNAVDRASEVGVFLGLEVTARALEAFYQKHDPEKVSQAATLAQKYSKKTALLMRVSQEKYGNTPETTSRKSAAEAKESATGGKPHTAGATPMVKPLAEQSTEELHKELKLLRQELARREEHEEQQRQSQQPESSEGSLSESDDEEFPFLSLADVVSSGPHKVAIIGGGPAGLSAATYAARAGLSPLVLAPAFGGQLLGKGVDVENYPGVVGEVATGRGLVEVMREQSRSFGARFVSTSVVSVDFTTSPLSIFLNGTDSALRAEAVILACGAESRWLQVEGEYAFRGRGVSGCATCDGFLYRNHDVAVIGGGDHAMEDALYLARTSRKVTVIHRGPLFRASRILAEKVLNHSSITVLWNTEVQAFRGEEEGLTHLELKRKEGSTTSSQRLDVSAAFVAIGHNPQTAFLKGHVDLDATGYVILPGGGGTATSATGVFAAGDIADSVYRQAITASGTGAQAALDVERYLNR